MSDEIEIKEGTAQAVCEVVITEARPSGWLAWYRYGANDTFMQAYDKPSGNSERDHHRCPYPLFPSREDAIDAAKYYLRGRGGEVRVVKVTL